jgi:hypothetical protein
VIGEQLPAVNTWFKLREIILLICTMATLVKISDFHTPRARNRLKKRNELPLLSQ